MRDLAFLALGVFLGFCGSMVGHVAAHLEPHECATVESAAVGDEYPNERIQLIPVEMVKA